MTNERAWWDVPDREVPADLWAQCADNTKWAAMEITQLRGNLSLAEEGLVSYVLEVERKNSLIDAQDAAQTSLHAENVRLRVENERLQMSLKRYEPVSLYNGHDIDWWKAEVERLRAALEEVRSYGDCDDSAKKMYWAATNALRGTTPQPETIMSAAAKLPQTLLQSQMMGYVTGATFKDQPQPHEPCEQSAKQDLAYYDGARAAAAMAHQSLSVMDKWINGGCGGRWQEAKAAMAEGAPRGAGSEPSEYMCPCGLNSVACRESACSEDKQRHLVGVPTPSRT